jgi:hypothetical protein
MGSHPVDREHATADLRRRLNPRRSDPRSADGPVDRARGHGSPLSAGRHARRTPHRTSPATRRSSSCRTPTERPGPGPDRMPIPTEPPHRIGVASGRPDGR